MMFRSVLITGGAGFIGSHLAVSLKRDFPGRRVVVFDNLSRRGSELNLARLAEHGVEFFYGDMRDERDLESLPACQLHVDCAADPAVNASLTKGGTAIVRNNLLGALNGYELARRHDAALLCLSTSRVYAIEALNALAFDEDETRFRWRIDQSVPGWSPRGIAENFSKAGPKSFYGAAKLSAEMLAIEYGYQHGMPVLINRCGIITGAGQFAKVDQGVAALWVARHVFDASLQYRGFGGKGKQVRDMLDVNDLYRLIVLQLERTSSWNGAIYNVGGGETRSFSLLELTRHVQQITAREIELGHIPETSPLDVRIYITDTRVVEQAFGWRPSVSLQQSLGGIYDWMMANREVLRRILTG